MNLHIPISEDLISILDSSAGQELVVESWIHVGLEGVELRVADARACVTSSSVYVGYGDHGHWEEAKDLENLFPFWRCDLWTK